MLRAAGPLSSSTRAMVVSRCERTPFISCALRRAASPACRRPIMIATAASISTSAPTRISKARHHIATRRHIMTRKTVRPTFCFATNCSGWIGGFRRRHRRIGPQPEQRPLQLRPGMVRLRWRWLARPLRRQRFRPQQPLSAISDGQFRDVAAEAGVEDIGHGMSAAWFDYDGDGRPDLYVSNMWSDAGQRVATETKLQPRRSGARKRIAATPRAIRCIAIAAMEPSRNRRRRSGSRWAAGHGRRRARFR